MFLTEETDSGSPQTHALMALMCFHLSRVAGRIDTDGIYLPLAQQDRAVWDRAVMERGSADLLSAGGGSGTQSGGGASLPAQCSAHALSLY